VAIALGWVTIGVEVALRTAESGVVIGPKRLVDNTHAYYHVAFEVLVPRNEGVSVLIFETDALRYAWPRVEAVEVLHRCDDGVGGVMRVNGNAERQAPLVW
jgi:hypothetical protein